MSDGKAELRAAMIESLNWREPGASITPPIPINRRWSLKRLFRWLTRNTNRN